MAATGRNKLEVSYEIMLHGMSRAQAGFTKLSNKIKTTEQGMKNVGQAAAGAFTNITHIMGMTMALRKTVQAGADFEFQLARVSAATGATAIDMARLRKQAIELNLATEFDPSGIIGVQQNLALAGFKVDEIMQSSKAVLDLATGSFGRVGLSEASQIAIAATRGFGLETSKLTETIDKMLKMTIRSNLQVADLRQSLSLAAPAANAMGQSLEETLVILGALRGTGLSASRSGTALANALTYVSRESSRSRLEMKLGIRLTDQYSGKLKKMGDIVVEIAQAMKGLNVEDRINMANKIFGIRGIRTLNAIQQLQVKTMVNGRMETLRMGEAIQFLRNEIDDSAGTASRFRENMNKTFVQQMKRLTSSFVGFITQIGEALLPVLMPPLTLLRATFEQLNLAMLNTPSILKTILAGALLLGTGLLVLGSVASMWQKVAFFFSKWMVSATTGLAKFTGVLTKVILGKKTAIAVTNTHNKSIIAGTTATNTNTASNVRNAFSLTKIKTALKSLNRMKIANVMGGIGISTKTGPKLHGIGKSNLGKTAFSSYVGYQMAKFANFKKDFAGKGIFGKFIHGMKGFIKVTIKAMILPVWFLLKGLGRAIAMTIGAAIASGPIAAVAVAVAGVVLAVTAFTSGLGYLKDIFFTLGDDWKKFSIIRKTMSEVFKDGIIKDFREIPADLMKQIKKEGLEKDVVTTANVRNIAMDSYAKAKAALDAERRRLDPTYDAGKTKRERTWTGNIFLSIYNAITKYGTETVVWLINIYTKTLKMYNDIVAWLTGTAKDTSVENMGWKTKAAYIAFSSWARLNVPAQEKKRQEISTPISTNFFSSFLGSLIGLDVGSRLKTYYDTIDRLGMVPTMTGNQRNVIVKVSIPENTPELQNNVSVIIGGEPVQSLVVTATSLATDDKNLENGRYTMEDHLQHQVF